MSRDKINMFNNIGCGGRNDGNSSWGALRMNQYRSKSDIAIVFGHELEKDFIKILLVTEPITLFTALKDLTGHLHFARGYNE